MNIHQIIKKEGYELKGGPAQLVKENGKYFIHSKTYVVDLKTGDRNAALFRGRRHYYHWNEVA